MVNAMAEDARYTSEQIAAAYVAWGQENQFRGYRGWQGEDMQRAIAQLVTARRSGEEIIELPDSHAAGDPICSSCPSFAERCWHGHPEYHFALSGSGLVIPDLPNGGEERSLYDGFSVDLLSTKPLLRDDSFEERLRLQREIFPIARKHNFRMDCFHINCFPSPWLTDGNQVAVTMAEAKPILFSQIWGFAKDVLEYTQPRGEDISRICVATGTTNGTSYTPESWRMRMHQGVSALFQVK